MPMKKAKKFISLMLVFCMIIISIQTKPTIPQTTLSRVFVNPPVVRFA